jgi:hypothetical protein
MLKFLMQYILTNNSALCWSVRVCSSKTKMESVKVNQNLLKFRVIRKMNGHIYYIENWLFVREFFWTADVCLWKRKLHCHWPFLQKVWYRVVSPPESFRPYSRSPRVVSPSFINSALKNEIWKIPLQIFVFWML